MRRAARAIAIGLVLAGAAVASCSVLFPLDCFDGSCGGASVGADDAGTADVLDASDAGDAAEAVDAPSDAEGDADAADADAADAADAADGADAADAPHDAAEAGCGVGSVLISPSTPDCNVLVPCTISNNLHAAFCGGSCALPKPNATITGAPPGCFYTCIGGVSCIKYCAQGCLAEKAGTDDHCVGQPTACP